jgi:hypothetical protein
MAESLTSQTVIAFSTAPESTYGTNPITAATFTSMVTRSREHPVTESEKFDDRGVVGRGNTMYPSFQRSGFRVPVAFEITDVVQVGTFAKLLRRYMGKLPSAPAVLEAAVAWKHTLNELDPTVSGLQLPSTSVIYQNNEFDFVHTGCIGSTLQIAQTGTADPYHTLAMASSGMAKRLSNTTDFPSFGTLTPPTQDPYMYGASSAAAYTNAVPVTVSLTTPEHKLRALTFNANNALITDDTRMGMPQADVTEPKRGWYRDFLHFGDREITMEWTMGMDGDYSLKDAEELNSEFTAFSWTMFGDKLSATNKNSLKIIIPKFALRLPRTGEENMKRTKTFTAFPLVHGAYYGVYSVEITNNSSAAIT